MSDQIPLTNLNIRQSIAILLAKLVLIDFIMAIFVIGFYLFLVKSENFIYAGASNTVLFLTVFGIIGTIKILLGIFVILKWLNEYYEINTEYISHKSGIIFKNEERYNFENMRIMHVQDSFLGEIFNFATITFYDIRLNKYMDMYLIHNPHRYAKVIKAIKPSIETKSDSIDLPFLKQLEKEEEKESNY